MAELTLSPHLEEIINRCEVKESNGILVKSNEKVVILLDLSWHLYRSYYSFKWMTAGEGGRPTGHIYGVLNTVQNLREYYPNSIIILCKDGVPVKRNTLMKENGLDYKSGRPELEYDFYKDIPYISALLFLLPNTYLSYNEDLESDDAMYALAKQVESLGVKSIIYSGDDDLLQAISPNISVLRKMTAKEIELIDNDYLMKDPIMVRKFQGTDSYHLPFYRAIVGDKSDKIPGITRFPHKIAHKIAMSANSFEDIFSYQVEKPTEDKYMTIIRDNRSTIELNYKLMKLNPNHQITLSRMRPKKEKVIALMRKWLFNKYYKYCVERGYLER